VRGIMQTSIRRRARADHGPIYAVPRSGGKTYTIPTAFMVEAWKVASPVRSPPQGVARWYLFRAMVLIAGIGYIVRSLPKPRLFEVRKNAASAPYRSLPEIDFIQRQNGAGRWGQNESEGLTQLQPKPLPIMIYGQSSYLDSHLLKDKRVGRIGQ
jgi:hypothetical protein